ncbi:C40 family peptidase [Clostridium akagii]|uniref:C40 family peptidase n=1 Tax=Clostridium akagii TaxID=91623 RepID=UPI00068CBB76|nr:C40 family peptidase [Clostridium akagii]
MKKNIRLVLFLATFFMLFTYTSHVQAAILPQSATVIDGPTSNQGITSGGVINIRGWAVNKSGIKNVQVIIDGNFLIGAQYNISRPDVNAAIPGYPSGNNSGYISSILAPSTLGIHTITIKATGNDGSTGSSNVKINVLSKTVTNQSINTLIGTSNQIVAYAEKFLGVPYVYGGATPAGFDCSGLIQYVYAHNGSYEIQLPRTTYSQINVGTSVAKSNLQPGDLVFFGSLSSPYHAGIYIGSNQFIEAPHTGANVRTATLSTRTDYCGARRIIK